jgi:hypothetical protein
MASISSLRLQLGPYPSGQRQRQQQEITPYKVKRTALSSQG